MKKLILSLIIFSSLGLQAQTDFCTKNTVSSPLVEENCNVSLIYDTNSLSTKNGRLYSKILVFKNISDLRGISNVDLDTGFIYKISTGEQIGDFTYFPNDSVTADDSVINIRTSNGQLLKRNIESAIYSNWFGTSGNGISDESPALQKMFDWINAHPLRSYSIIIPAGNYKVNSTVHLPKRINTSAESIRIEIVGYGVRVFTTNPIKLWDRLPSTQIEAQDSLIANWIGLIKGIVFEGSSTSGQVGIDLGATYNWTIEGCNFSNLDTALIVRFGLQDVLSNCRFTLNKSENIVLTDGGLWGGGHSNSATNSMSIENCRVFGASGAYSHLHAFASNGLIVRNFITEGFKPYYNFILDGDASTTVTACSLENLHVESFGGAYLANTVFRIRSSGNFIIKNVYLQYPDTLFNSIGSTGTIIFDGLPYTNNLPSVAFNAGGLSTLGYNLKFLNVTDGPGFHTKLINPSAWVGGVTPFEVFNTYEKTSGSGSLGIATNGSIDLEPGYGDRRVKVGGSLIFPSDNTYDIGVSGANFRPHSLAMGTGGVHVDNLGVYGFGSQTVTSDVAIGRDEAGRIAIVDNETTFNYRDLHARRLIVDSASGTSSALSLSILDDNDFITKKQYLDDRNAASFILSSGGSKTISENSILTFIIVKPSTTLTAFKVGITNGGDELVSTQSISSGSWKVLPVNYYSETGNPVYINGITSTTQIKIVCVKID